MKNKFDKKKVIEKRREITYLKNLFIFFTFLSCDFFFRRSEKVLKLKSWFTLFKRNSYPKNDGRHKSNRSNGDLSATLSAKWFVYGRAWAKKMPKAGDCEGWKWKKQFFYEKGRSRRSHGWFTILFPSFCSSYHKRPLWRETLVV